jgi:hypothetical protein
MLLPRGHDMHEDVLDVATVSAVVGEQHGGTTDAEQVGDQHGLEVPKVLVLGDVLRADHDRVRVAVQLQHVTGEVDSNDAGAAAHPAISYLKCSDLPFVI